jgi:hypothetical protein
MVSVIEIGQYIELAFVLLILVTERNEEETR